MNFNNRDVLHQSDHVQPFAYLEIIDDKLLDGMIYRLTTRRVNGTRPTTEGRLSSLKRADDVAVKIRSALTTQMSPFAGRNIRITKR